MRITGVFFVIIFMIVFMAVGAFGMYFYQRNYQPTTSGPNMQLAQSDQQELDKLRGLKSDVVSLIMLYGQVTNVSGNEITLSLNQSNLSFKLDPQASVASVDTSSENQTQSSASVSDIKPGTNIQVGAQLSFDNQLTGYSVLIVK